MNKNNFDFDTLRVIHCDTKEKSDDLLRFLHSKGYLWSNGEELIDHDCFQSYEQNTCYRLERGRVYFGYISWYKEHRFEIVEWEIKKDTQQELNTLIFQTKFNIGEEVYLIEHVPIMMKCCLCEGEGIIEYKNNKLECPSCKGKKELNIALRYWQVRSNKVTIWRMGISYNGKDTNIKYRFKGTSRKGQDKIMFRTLEEAQQRCDELNNDIV